MPRRHSDAGFGLVIVAAVLIAAGFAGFLFWRSQQGGNHGGDTPAPSPVVETPTPTPTPTPAPTSSANAQPLEPDDRLPLGTGTSGVRYSVSGGVVTFQFDIAQGEWPSVDVDFDRDGTVDEGVDRTFTFFPGNGRYCAQALLARDRWGECGSVQSNGSVELASEGRRMTAYLRVPVSELSNDPQTAYVTFKLCTGRGRQTSCRQSPGGRTDGMADFTDEYAIKLQ
jgi:hypothetical protein